MRPLYLSAAPLGFFLLVLFIPALVILLILAVFSRRAAKRFEQFFEPETKE